MIPNLNNYTHTHLHHQHILYSYELFTPPQFTQTHTIVDNNNQKIIHNHHVYRIINIKRRPKPRRQDDSGILNVGKLNYKNKNKNKSQVTPIDSPLIGTPKTEAARTLLSIKSTREKPNLTINTQVKDLPGALSAPRNFQTKPPCPSPMSLPPPPPPINIKKLQSNNLNNIKNINNINNISQPPLNGIVKRQEIGHIPIATVKFTKSPPSLDTSKPIANNQYISKEHFKKIINSDGDDGGYLYYFNDYQLRKRIKDSHPHFSLSELNQYLLNSWNNMNDEEKTPWIKKDSKVSYNQYRKSKTNPIVEIKWKPRDLRNKTNEYKKESVESIPQQPSFSINMEISKSNSANKYTNNELVNKEVCTESGKKGKIVSTYKRKGKQIRFRVKWEDGSKSLLYKKSILAILLN